MIRPLLPRLQRQNTLFPRSALLVALALATVAAGCDQATAPSAPEIQTAPDLTASAVSEPGHEHLARTLAAGLSVESVRQQLLAALRQSRLNEHKVVIQQFASTPAGRRLLEAAAGASNLPITTVHELVAGLPLDMDFYVPVRSHRRTWRGSPDIAVAAILEVDAPSAIAFFPDGSERTVKSPEAAGVDAFFVLHPAEPKDPREGPAHDGPTIEDPNGSTETTTLSEDCGTTAIVECTDPNTGSSTRSPGTYVGSIAIDFADGAFSGDPEIYFVTCLTGGGSCVTTGERSVPAFGTALLNLQIHSEQASSLNEMRAKLWEADSFLNGGDDFKGESLPLITGAGGYLSYDLFHDKIWADYQVFLDD